MGRTLTPQRRELFEEAIELRRAGLTEQNIAEILGQPRRTIAYWLIVANCTTTNLAKETPLGKNSERVIGNNSLTFYHGKYEDVALRIPNESIDLIITDPPYVVADTDITRTGRADFKRNHGQWDRAPDEQYASYVDIWAELMALHLKDGASLYLFMDTRKHHLWTTAFESRRLIHRNTLIWHRSNPAPQIRVSFPFGW